MGNTNPWPLAWSLTAACLVVLLGGGGYIVYAMQPEKVSAPTSYASFVATDKAFQCTYPSGWKARQGQPQGIASWAEFKKGSAIIEIDATLQGSLQGDILTAQQSMADNMGGDFAGVSGGGMPGVPGMPGEGGGAQRRPPVETLHEAGAEAQEDEKDDYNELAPQKFPSAMGDARISEYTYTGDNWSGKKHGYRVTILGGDKLFSINCECTERDWPLLKPAFIKTLNSIGPGGG